MTPFTAKKKAARRDRTSPVNVVSEGREGYAAEAGA
jgi:hypothetical protein